MKKLLIILTAAVLFLCLAGCGKPESDYIFVTGSAYWASDDDSAGMPLILFNDDGTYELSAQINISMPHIGTYITDGNTVKLTSDPGFPELYLEFEIIGDGKLEFKAENSAELTVTSLENGTKTLKDGVQFLADVK